MKRQRERDNTHIDAFMFCLETCPGNDGGNIIDRSRPGKTCVGIFW